MFRTFVILMLSYLALAAQVIGTPGGTVTRHLPALVVVLAVRWLSPRLAAVWAFGIGLAVDALGTGALGLHAAVLVVLAALFTRGGESRTETSAWQLAMAVFFTAWCDAVLPEVWDFVVSRRWQPLEHSLVSCTLSACSVAAAAGVLMSISRLGMPKSHWTGG